MTPFEYLLPLVSVLAGLAVADVTTSLHRLLRARHRVRWDWMPLAAALLAVSTVFNLWWGLFHSQEAFFGTLGEFLPLAAQLVVLFLMNAAALPDDVPEDGIDLRAFYRSNGPYFWSLYATYVLIIVLYNAIPIVVAGAGEGPGPWEALVRRVGPNFGVFLVLAALAWVRVRWFHACTIAALLALFAVRWSGMSVGG